MMFDLECANETYAPSVYPCVGADVALWSASCLQV